MTPDTYSGYIPVVVILALYSGMTPIKVLEI
jgi:hypothetical protein